MINTNKLDVYKITTTHLNIARHISKTIVLNYKLHKHNCPLHFTIILFYIIIITPVLIWFYPRQTRVAKYTVLYWNISYTIPQFRPVTVSSFFSVSLITFWVSQQNIDLCLLQSSPGSLNHKQGVGTRAYPMTNKLTKSFSIASFAVIWLF